MIYHSASNEIKDVQLVGGPDDIAGIIVPEYASDYAVVATYKLLK